MAYFDRFDICEAYLAMEWDWHVSGVLQERASNQRRNMSTDYQLDRMGFKCSPLFRGYESLTENGKDIYDALCERYGFEREEEETDNVVREYYRDAATATGMYDHF